VTFTTNCSERHYKKIVSIVADISSDLHYIYSSSDVHFFVFTVWLAVVEKSMKLNQEKCNVASFM